MYPKVIGRFIFALAVCLCTAESQAQPLPAPFQAQYEGSKFPLSAQVTIALSRRGDYYRYTLRGTVRAAFFKWADVYDCSVLRVDGDTFYPIEYVHRDSRERRHDVHMRFDWKHRSAQTTRGDGTVHEISGLPAIAWDPLSIQLRLRADAAAGTAERSYDIVEKDEVKHRRVRIGRVDELRSDQRSLQIVRVETIDGKHGGAFWFAKNYGWLPIRVSMGGVTLDLISPPEDAARAAMPAAPDGAVPGC